MFFKFEYLSVIIFVDRNPATVEFDCDFFAFSEKKNSLSLSWFHPWLTRLDRMDKQSGWNNLCIDLAKLKSGLRIFFSRTSQGQNALPRLGLEPGLNTHVKSSTLYGRPYGHKSKFFWLDGLLLLFCIIMGLRSASSAITAGGFVGSSTGNRSAKLSRALPAKK